MAHIGLMIEGQNGLNWQRWQRVLHTAEDSGYQCVFRSDHYTNASGDDLDSLELWVSLTYAATHTKRIEFGSLVAPTTFRHPTITARMAAQVDDLSGGRLVLGLGAGWQDREHHKFGVPFYDFKTRFEMLTDALEITTLLFQSDTYIRYTGKHFSLHDAVLLPRPARAGGPPLLIGGSGPKKTLPLAARYADEWNAVFIPLELFKERTALLDELLVQHGRKPESCRRSLMTQVIYGRNQGELQDKLSEHNASAEELIQRGFIVGTAPQVVDQLGIWAEAGIQRFMLQWLDLDDMDSVEDMAKNVLPHFHR
jgi:F420-dependent oxidoreductase-like protein